MLDHQALVAEDGDAGNGVHVFGMQEVDELRQVVNVDLMLAEQRVLERNGDAAIGIFDVENYGVAADFAPVADDAQSVIAGCHDAGQVDGTDFKIFGNGNCLFDDGRGQDSGDRDLLAVLQDVAGTVAIYLADGFSQLGRRQVPSLVQILVGDGGNAFSALRGVDLRCRGGQSWQRRL